MQAVGGRSRRLVLWVVGVVVAFLAAVGAWAVATPPGSAPDDAFHLATTYCAWGESSRCVETAEGPMVPQRIAETFCFLGKPFDSAVCLNGLGDNLVAARVDEGTYPPVFHNVMRVFAGDDVARSVVVMRLANVLVAALLLGATLLLAGRPVRRATAMAWLVGLVPVGMFFIASINPTAWAITGVGLYWAALLTWFRVDRGRAHRWLTGGLVVATAVVAAGSRSDAGGFILVSALAVVILAWPAVRLAPRRLWLLAALAPLLLWSLSIQVLSILRGGLRGDGAVEGDMANGIPDAGLGNNLRELVTFVAGVFGVDKSAFDFGPTGYAWGLGPLDTPLPSVVGLLAVACAGFVLLHGLRAYNLRKVVAVTLVAAAIVGYPLLILARTPSGTPGSLQPRYVLPLIIVLLGVASLAAGRRADRLRLVPGVALTIALTVATSIALAVTMRRFTNGLFVPWSDLLVEPSWWWGWGPSPLAVWLVGTVGAAAYFTLLVTISRQNPVATPVAEGAAHYDGAHRADARSAHES